MAQYLGLDKFMTLFRIIKENGGITKSAYKLFVQDELKWGTLVGEDKYGNRYYENNYYFFGRNRWIEYNDNYFLDYDGSQVPAEWHGWLHYRTDLTPDCDPSRHKYPWMADHTENLTGTPKAYVPYSTTRPKIQAWIPPKNDS